MSECLYQAYGKKCIILIDEYDVPLESSYFRGYYDEMVAFIRSLFESALKTNPCLEFAVIIGCLRVSRESIFTGLNNLRMCSILDESYGEYFGFTDAEVQEMLASYGREAKLEETRRWYDGYNHISAWFDKKQKGFELSPLYAAIEEGDTEAMEQEISGFLEKTISYFDYGESYYHGFLAGLLGQNGKYRVLSNREAGLGCADIILKTPRIRGGRAFVLELKAVKKFAELETGCEDAVRQIQEKKYEEELREEGYQDVMAYGICFFRKECVVGKGE